MKMEIYAKRYTRICCSIDEAHDDACRRLAHMRTVAGHLDA
jgi:hypothetical protein